MTSRAITRALTAGALLLVLTAAAACTSDEPEPTPTSGPSAVATVTPASTPVAPPTPGTTRSAVSSRPVDRDDPVALDAEAAPADGVSVRLSSVQAIQATASGPGEVAGPALAVTVVVANATGDRLDLTLAAVNLLDAAGDPGSLMSTDPARPLPASVADGASVDGVYVFTLPTDQRSPVAVEVTVSPDEPVVVFRGRAPE